MVLKSQIEYQCPQCSRAWLPHRTDLHCPECGRAVPNGEITAIVAETLESARFNKRLYGRFSLEYWLARRLGDRYMAWAFKALEIAEANPALTAQKAALAALLELDLEEMSPFREHIFDFMVFMVERYRSAAAANPAEWQKMPEPEKPFFGRKIIDDETTA